MNHLYIQVSMQSILIKIGFNINGDELLFNFHNGKMKAIQGINRYFQEGLFILGYTNSKRNAEKIDFFLPLYVESYEQGLAFIAFYLQNTDFKKKPDWLNDGLALKEHLPWEKKMKAYKENPTATIEHEWFRVLVNKLRILISTSTFEDETTFSFKGGHLEVTCNKKTFVVSGYGNDWQRTAKVKTKSLDFLPKRFPKKNILIYVWEGHLHIQNRLFKLEM